MIVELRPSSTRGWSYGRVTRGRALESYAPVQLSGGAHLALLVDHDADTRQAYAEYLTAAHWRIEQASDGREALAKAYSVRPAIIVTDARLPGISGYDLCELLRRDTMTERIHQVVVTSDTDVLDIADARAAGADTVLTKPCLPITLLIEMQRLLATSAAVRGRADAILARLPDQLARANDALRRSEAAGRNRNLKQSHRRGQTTTPPLTPPSLVCPDCDAPLTYRRSHLGGVSSKHPEQWDYYDCPSGCGTFQHRTRTRKVRKVV